MSFAIYLPIVPKELDLSEVGSSCLYQLTVVYKITSSAYNLTLDKMPVGKSFMKYKNNNRARMVPCGTPDVTWVASLNLFTTN